MSTSTRFSIRRIVFGHPVRVHLMIELPSYGRLPLEARSLNSVQDNGLLADNELLADGLLIIGL